MYLRLFLEFLSCFTGLLLQVTATLLRQNSATWTRLYSLLSLPSAGTPACHFSLNFRISLCRTQEKQAGIFMWNFVKRIILEKLGFLIEERICPYMCSSLLLWALGTFYKYSSYGFCIFPIISNICLLLPYTSQPTGVLCIQKLWITVYGFSISIIGDRASVYWDDMQLLKTKNVCLCSDTVWG